MMSIDLGNTLALLGAFALVAGPIVARSLNRIAHFTVEELKIKERMKNRSGD